MTEKKQIEIWQHESWVYSRNIQNLNRLGLQFIFGLTATNFVLHETLVIEDWRKLPNSVNSIAMQVFKKGRRHEN